MTLVVEPNSAVQDELTERLLQAAAEVFAENGYEKAGVAEIARRAGVTTGAIYSRYSGKAELGGDGLINQAVNVLAGTDTVLGLIPVGTGNDFARSLNL